MEENSRLEPSSSTEVSVIMADFVGIEGEYSGFQI